MSAEAPEQDSGGERIGSYVYGILRSGQRIPEDLEAVDTGSESGESGLGLVSSGPLAAVISDVAVDRPLGTRQHLLAHERVLNAIAADAAVLPMRFGAVLTDDDAVRAELLDPHREYFSRALEDMAELVQFSLRGDYEQDVVLTRIVEENPSIRDLRERISGMDEDASYYDRVKLGEAVSQAMDAIRAADAQAVVDALGRYAVATVVKEVSGETGAVHVAFLIRRDHRTDFERAVDDLGDEWSGRVDLRLFGPTACFDFLPEYDVPDGDTQPGAAGDGG
ncbi:GvpL/GvpF family gas vesicle protein [Actinomycetospora termitidis]|uniref:GvpL/GvpF family gas vesicle protein n=1 Tax=Actinomycetospora termitidis TaxID=3053470 RepID=A0ABT7M8I9_9PSEU|nr:GvpL/GvpF family gas vesicle protein [Actinomycetospora sp. Odt1-22]MDL5156967.1 GvpL/GvpF family gas vesicle protein [Actinomycetospora sp. Odt1-22]